MSKKIFLIYTLLFSLLIFISTKEEKSEKFLSFNSDNDTTPEDGTDPDDGTSPGDDTNPDDGDTNKKSSTKLINVKCLYSKGYNIYSLQPLQKKGDYQIQKNGNTILFNFCKNTEAVNNATFVQKIDDSN